MKIDLTNPLFYYSLFYLFAGIFTLISLIFISIKRKYPLLQILLLISFASFATIVGTKLFTIPFNEWGNIVLTADISTHNNRSAMGGLLFGLIALLFVHKFLGMKKSVLDVYAILTPLALAIQKFGCFFNGCCYGNPTDLPWGVCYPKHTAVHFHHYTSGLIGDVNSFSQNVHPVQIYEVLSFVLVGFLVWKFSQKFKKTGSTILFSLVLMFVFRFITEFLRDPASSQFNEHYLLGIRVFEWFLLTIAILFASILFVYEKKSTKDFLLNTEAEISFNKVISLLVALALLTFVFRGLFTGIEIITLSLRFIPALVLAMVFIFRTIMSNKSQMVYTTFILLSFVLMSQSLPKDTSTLKIKRRIDFGLSAGSLITEASYNPHVGSCGGVSYDEDYYRHDYMVTGIGISELQIHPKYSLKLGFNIYAGINNRNNLTKQWVKQDNIFGLNPYLKHDLKWIGYGLGFHLGNLLMDYNTTTENYKSIGNESYTVQPELSFRVGRVEYFYFQMSYASAFSSTFPADFAEFSIGSGLGSMHDRHIRIGMIVPNFALYFKGELQIQKEFGANLQCAIPVIQEVGPFGQIIPRVSLGVFYNLH